MWHFDCVVFSMRLGTKCKNAMAVTVLFVLSLVSGGLVSVGWLLVVAFGLVGRGFVVCLPTAAA